MTELQDLNRLEIKGRIGSIKISNLAETKVARISVATNYMYRDKEGCVVIETEWHDCTAFPGKKICFENLEKGDAVHIVGRLRTRRYTDANNVDHTYMEVVVNELEKIEKEEK